MEASFEALELRLTALIKARLDEFEQSARASVQAELDRIAHLALGAPAVSAGLGPGAAEEKLSAVPGFSSEVRGDSVVCLGGLAGQLDALRAEATRMRSELEQLCTKVTLQAEKIECAQKSAPEKDSSSDVAPAGVQMKCTDTVPATSEAEGLGVGGTTENSAVSTHTCSTPEAATVDAGGALEAAPANAASEPQAAAASAGSATEAAAASPFGAREAPAGPTSAPKAVAAEGDQATTHAAAQAPQRPELPKAALGESYGAAGGVATPQRNKDNFVMVSPKSGGSRTTASSPFAPSTPFSPFSPSSPFGPFSPIGGAAPVLTEPPHPKDPDARQLTLKMEKELLRAHQNRMGESEKRKLMDQKLPLMAHFSGRQEVFDWLEKWKRIHSKAFLAGLHLV